MADNFTPITLNTQEDVDHFMSDRLLRARRAGAEEEAKKYAGFDDFKAKAAKYDTDIAALKEKISGLEGEKSALEAKNREYETNSAKMRIAREYGVSEDLLEAAQKLAFATEENDIRNASEGFAKQIPGQQVYPMYLQSGENVSNTKDGALKDLLKKFRNEN